MGLPYPYRSDKSGRSGLGTAESLPRIRLRLRRPDNELSGPVCL
jgi:hypothetical protein